jgi:ABC-2 type transport system ATP-binding protein
MAMVIARMSQVHKRYGAVAALDGLDLSLAEGEMLALLGPNGAGKTTAIHVLLGLLPAGAGAVEVLGQPVQAGRPQHCAAVFQQMALPDPLRVSELLSFARSTVANPRPWNELVAVGGLETLLDQRYGQLSGGQQRRVQLALALATRPRVLFLDEPTNGMDRASRQRLFETLDAVRNEGTAILLSTHILEEIERHADRLLLIRAGRAVLDGAPHALRAQMGQREIRAETTLEDADLLACGYVGPIVRQGRSVRLQTAEAEALVRALLSRDPQLSGLQVQPLSLDDVLQHHESEALA